MRQGLLFILIGATLIVLGGAVLLLLRDPGPPETLAEASAAVKSTSAPTAAEWDRLRLEAEQGNPTAQNNLGVALWRLPDRAESDKKAEAQRWFMKAADQGHIQARYNLALTLPDRRDTDPATIQRRLALLQENAEAGDVHSMVALARSLYFANRDAFVSDRQNVRRDMLARAAATGDADYLVSYGKTLWNDVRGGADPALLAAAIPALHAAYEAGEPRGAETLGAILANRNPAFRQITEQALDELQLEADTLLWFRRAGDLGLVTARCRYAFELFRTRDWIRSPDMGLIERHFRAGPDVLTASPEALAQAITDLEVCAANPKRKRQPRLPFGDEALYAYKLRGTWTSMTTQPGWANITLGVLFGFGIGVEPAPDRARQFLQTAADRDGFAIAEEILDSLPGL